MRHIQIAREEVCGSEGCHLHAYPDPASPMGKALGWRGIEHWGRTGEPPPGTGTKLDHLHGAPWTIGWGETRNVHRGMVWTQAQADAALERRLVEFDRDACRTWPGADQLHPAARAALISLAYNRGTKLAKSPSDSRDRRREMRELGPAIAAKDYLQMARLIRSMKRLWEGRGLAGLLARRDREAALCELAHRESGSDKPETLGEQVRRQIRNS